MSVVSGAVVDRNIEVLENNNNCNSGSITTNMQNSTLNPTLSSTSSSGSGSVGGSASVSGSGVPSVGNSSAANSATDVAGSTVGHVGDSSANIPSSVNSSTSTSNGHDTKHNGFTGTNESGTVDLQNNHDQSIVPIANHNLHLDKSNQEIIRLIGQYLQDIGLEKSVKTLMTESGCYLEHPAASKFREHVLSGEWNKADVDLKVSEYGLSEVPKMCKHQYRYTLYRVY